MGKRLPYTPNSKIKAALRKLWLMSREHQAALKRDNYSCVKCHAKKSVARGREVKVEVHHKNGVPNWQAMYDVIREHLLCHEDELETLCKPCHKSTK
jgi:hypothetical protein